MDEAHITNIKKYIESKIIYLKKQIKLESKTNKIIHIRGQLDALNKLLKLI